MTLKLNGQELGSAAQPQLWTPKAVSYHLTLEDDQVRAVDRVLFSIDVTWPAVQPARRPPAAARTRPGA
jgi:hypothetical protein